MEIPRSTSESSRLQTQSFLPPVCSSSPASSWYSGSVSLVQRGTAFLPCWLSDIVVVQLLSCVQLFATPWTVAHQAPLSLGSPRQGYWSGRHFPLQGICPTRGSNPGLLHWQTDSLSSEAPGKPSLWRHVVNLLCGWISVLVWGL